MLQENRRCGSLSGNGDWHCRSIRNSGLFPACIYALPLLPAMASMENKIYNTTTTSLWDMILIMARFPLKYLANLFSAGDTVIIKEYPEKNDGCKNTQAIGNSRGCKPCRKQMQKLLRLGFIRRNSGCIYSDSHPLHSYNDRFVIPPAHREEAIELIEQTSATRKENAGFGFIEKPERGIVI